MTPAVLFVDGELDTPSFRGSVRIKVPTADETPGDPLRYCVDDGPKV